MSMFNIVPASVSRTQIEEAEKKLRDSIVKEELRVFEESRSYSCSIRGNYCKIPKISATTVRLLRDAGYKVTQDIIDDEGLWTYIEW